jgi:hypothetical protein
MRRFKHKHDSEITAEKSYSYSTHYLILNKVRMVMCTVACDDIENSKSWEEIIEEPEYKEKNFNLDASQVKKFEIWRKRKNRKKGEVYVGAVGGAYTFCFTPTGIGTIAKVKCADGTELDITHENEF